MSQNIDSQPQTRTGRRTKTRAKAPAPTPIDQAAIDAGEVTPWGRPGTKLRTKPGAAGRGFYAPRYTGAPSSTRQAAVLNTALIGPATGTRGITSGRDMLSDTPVTHDPVTAYNDGQITSPNVLCLGDVGGGKSSLVKTVFVMRPLILKNRRVVVYDKKDRAGEGEYAELVRTFGAEPIRFASDNTGSRLNLLDPVIVRGTGLRGQSQLLQTVVRLANNNAPMLPGETEAVRSALRATFRDAETAGRVPVLADVLPHLDRAGDQPEYDHLNARERDRISEAGQTVHWVLNGLLDEYSGLLDGETSKSVNLDGKLTSFDISQLPSESPAVPVVMAIGNMWMLGRLRHDRTHTTNVVYEEGWHMIGGPSAELLKSNQKLSRSLGISNVFVMHKGTDIPVDSPGYSMIQEAQTVYVHKLSVDTDIDWAVRTFGFDPATAGVIRNLGQGQHIFKYGNNAEIQVQHIRSEWETALTDTNEGMAAGGAAEA